VYRYDLSDEDMVGDLDQSVLNIAQILPINIPNDINTNVA
jgi:hypothetical protein